MDVRVGIGYDVHRWESGRPLILGGVRISSDRGLKGHSDADVLAHAITDALLGALGQGDIGEHFPDDDPRFKNADSMEFLRFAHQLVVDRGFRIANLDCVLVLEQPKLKPYKTQIKESLAKVLHLNCDQIGLKAKTEEKLGFVGRGEGMKVYATVLLQEHA